MNKICYCLKKLHSYKVSLVWNERYHKKKKTFLAYYQLISKSLKQILHELYLTVRDVHIFSTKEKGIWCGVVQNTYDCFCIVIFYINDLHNVKR